MASTDGVISTPQELWTKWALPQAILGSDPIRVRTMSSEGVACSSLWMWYAACI